MTAEELIAEIKAECEHNIKILEKRAERKSTGYELGYIEGRRGWDADMLEKIETWEKENKL